MKPCVGLNTQKPAHNFILTAIAGYILDNLPDRHTYAVVELYHCGTHVVCEFNGARYQLPKACSDACKSMVLDMLGDAPERQCYYGECD